MQKRRIEDWEIDQVLATLDSCTTYPSAQDATRTVILGRTLSGRRLKIVALADDNEEVITVADRDNED
jgi:hypothetical protein